MKKIKIVLFTVFLFGLSLAQKTSQIKVFTDKNQNLENDTIPKISYSKPINYSTIVLLNGKYTSLETLNILNPESIKSTSVEKGAFKNNNRQYTGKIVIETKSAFKSTFLTIDEVAKKYAHLNKDENYICSIDGKIINADKNNTLIAEKNILHIKIVKLNKIETPADLILIEILTKTRKRINNAGGIRIRGNDYH